MTKSALDRAIAHKLKRIASRRFPHTKIKWLLSLYEGREKEDKELSIEDYEFIKSIYHFQKDRLRELSSKQLDICNRIYERYQSKDVR